MIDINACLGDSPRLRQQLLSTDRNLGQLESALKLLCKSMRLSGDANRQLVQANTALADAVHEVARAEQLLSGGQEADSPSGSALVASLSQMADELKHAELSRKQFASEVERDVLDCLDSFCRHELGSLRELKRRWEKGSLEFAHCNAKYMGKKGRDGGLFEAAVEVADARKDFHTATLDFAIKLNELTESRLAEVFGALARYIQLSTDFYSRQNKSCSALEPPLQLMSATARASAEAVGAMVQAMVERKQRIVVQSEPVYNPLIIDRTPTPAPAAKVDLQDLLTDDSLLKEGYLYKKSSHAMRPVWSRRFFALYSDRLEYYSQQGGNAPVPIDLRVCTIKGGSDTERRFCFEIVSPIKTFTLQAENESEQEQWMDCLAAAIQVAIQRPRDEPAKRSPPADGQSRAERPASASEIAAIKALPGNDKCAECGADDPKWASLNHGVLLCIACSGVHRGLGSRVSKVRSLQLDYWEPVQISLMLSLGNAAVNAELEKTYCAAESFYCKPTVGSDQSTREHWVTAKYELLKFVRAAEDQLQAHELLWSGLQHNNTVQVYLALRLGADPNAPRPGQSYPLLHALAHDQYAHALLLLYNEADPWVSDRQGSTALHILAAKDTLDAHGMLGAFLRRRIATDATDADHRTALDIAIACANRSAERAIRMAVLQDQLDSVKIPDDDDEGKPGEGSSKKPHASAKHKKLIKKIAHHMNK